MDFPFIAYIFFCIVAILYTFTQLQSSNRVWAAILSVVLFILIFVFYGQRWFRGEESILKYSGKWPPMINMCPDYLVYYKSGNKEACIDLLGVSSKQGGGLPLWTNSDSASNPDFGASTTNKYFKFVYKPGADKTRLQELCTKTMEKGYTWEGITNGESCTFPQA